MMRCVTAILAVLLLAFGGCSERITNDNDGQPIEITLDRSAALSLQTIASEFRVIVTRLSGESVVTCPLTLVGNQLVGTVTHPAANQTLRFTVEAIEQETGTVLYRGSIVATVRPYRLTTLTVSMQPVAPLLRINPSYILLGPDLSFHIDTRLYNLPNTYGISYRVLWPIEVDVIVDSIVANPVLYDDPSVIFFSQAGTMGASLSYYAFSITETDSTDAIVDVDGDADLVRLYYRLPGHLSSPYTLSLWLEVTSLTANEDGQIVDLPIDTLFPDQCLVEDPPEVTVLR